MTEETFQKNDPNSPPREEDITIFKSLADHTKGKPDQALISKDTILNIFNRHGISMQDIRVKQGMDFLHSLPDKDLNQEQFVNFIHGCGAIGNRMLQGRLVIPDFEHFCQSISSIYEKTIGLQSGHVASYIPQLSSVDPEKFAISICTVDGQRFSIGDSSDWFCVQSVCKPINYSIAIQENSEKVVHQHMGREPSGTSFNALALNHHGLPHNPMINAGGIMCCSLIGRDLNGAERFDYITQMWHKLSGEIPRFSNSVYLSEKETADRNYALAYYMKEQGAFPPETDIKTVLDFYFQCCALEVTSDMASVVAASLASGGICPITRELIFRPEGVKNCLSLMSSCGMYDFSGEFNFKIGLPAKSGVSGMILLVIPNVMGISIWSPRLDAMGNSVRGVEFCNQLVQEFNFHAFDNVILQNSSKTDPRRHPYEKSNLSTNSLMWAAWRGDLHGMRENMANQADINATDYDHRTVLHVAAAEGHEDIVRYLINVGAPINKPDRWGRTPLDEAEFHHHDHITNLLRQLGGLTSKELIQTESQSK
ncbi:MAG: glutaminase A [Zetaproteobacteria bacterium]|nr:glutaminase A [Pseudobdellovibrionaceae bacterium]